MDEYYCPNCGAILYYKLFAINIWHYIHALDREIDRVILFF